MATKATITKGNAKPAAKKSTPVATAGYLGPTSKEQDKWRAEDDLRTLQRAGEVTSDPSRVNAAKALANQQMKALEAIKKS